MIVVVQAEPDDARPCAVDAEEHSEPKVVVHMGEGGVIVVCRLHAQPRTLARVLAAADDDESPSADA